MQSNNPLSGLFFRLAAKPTAFADNRGGKVRRHKGPGVLVHFVASISCMTASMLATGGLGVKSRAAAHGGVA